MRYNALTDSQLDLSNAAEKHKCDKKIKTKNKKLRKQIAQEKL